MEPGHDIPNPEARMRMDPDPLRDAPPHAPEHPPYAVVPRYDTLGVRHVAEAMRDLVFPMTVAELRERAGLWLVPIVGTHTHALHELLENIPDGRKLHDANDVVRAIVRAHPEMAETSFRARMR